MTSVLLPFLMSMFLGRTIDLRTYRIGGDVFDYTQYDQVKLNVINTTYTVLQDNTFPYTYMGLPVDLALRIKSGYSSSTSDLGLDRFLKETTWKQRSAVVLVATAVQTMQRTLKQDAKPVRDWTNRISPFQTHYANSLIYGGWAFILYRFKCDIPGDVEIVRKTLTDVLGVQGSLGPNTSNLWEKAKMAISKNKEIRGEVHVYVSTYSTFPFKHSVSTFSELINAVEEIPKLVGPVGKPIGMQLLPLHRVNPKYRDVKENHKLDRQLEELSEMFDDVKNTKDSINRWMDGTTTILSEDDETKIADLTAHLSACLILFRQVASEASIYKRMDPKLIKSAIDLYNLNLTSYTYTYDRIFRRLKEDLDAECEDTFLHKIRGLLQVDDSERIEVGEVEGGLEECKSACLAAPNCRSIGYVEKLMNLKKMKASSPSMYKLTMKTKICYVYFRSSSTADVTPPMGASIAGVYDRKCA